MDRVHPEDRDILRGTMANVYDGNAYQEVEFRVVSPSGEERHLYDVLEADFDSEGHPIRVFGVIQDVTEARLAEQALRESEQRFRSVVDNLPNAVLIKDREHRFISVNKNFENFFNRTQEQVIGKTGLSVLSEHQNREQRTASTA